MGNYFLLSYMRKLSLLFLLCITGTLSFSQKLDLNFFLGTSNYEGDMQANFFTFSQPGLAVGGGLSYHLSSQLAIRAGITYAKVGADDKKNPKVYFRNLNFKSEIQEFHVAAEYYLFNSEAIKVSPYIFAGIAVYHFNPYTKDTSGKTFFLQPLSTEGQGFYLDRKPYSLTQFAVPFGGGIKYPLTDNIKLGIEVGLRKLFTDYLDDVSTTYIDPNLLLANRGPKALELAYRGGEINSNEMYPTALTKRGEPKNKDWYYFTGITLSFRLPGKGESRSGWDNPGNRKKYIMGCPTK
jgi:opacity protein-like surface antigen